MESFLWIVEVIGNGTSLSGRSIIKPKIIELKKLKGNIDEPFGLKRFFFLYKYHGYKLLAETKL